LILTDLDMPNIDGIALARIVKMQNPGTRILPMSGHGSRDLGYDGTTFAGPVLQKPFSRDILLEQVRNALKGNASPS
jgi:DNA-binding NtrC family response regulator